MKNTLIILAGGFGTRLQSVTNGTPKALIPVGNSNYIDLLLRRMSKYEFPYIYLSLHYKPELFKDYINNSIFKNNLISIIEPEPLGTGGAINYVINNADVSTSFFVINGDSLSNIDLGQMYKNFNNANLNSMLGISLASDTSRYGRIVEKDGKILSFNEKGARGKGWINNGHYIFNKEIFHGCSGAFSLERTILPRLVKNRELGSYKVENDNFIDMGIPEDYEKLCKKYESNH